MIKVLHVITHLNLGGAEVSTENLLREYAASQEYRGKISSDVFSVDGRIAGKWSEEFYLTINSSIEKLHFGSLSPNSLRRYLESAVILRRVLRNEQYDIIHLHTEIPDFCMFVSILFGGKKHKIVRSIHNTLLWKTKEYIGFFIERRFADTARIYVSSGAEEAWNQLSKKWKINHSSKIESVIYNGRSSYVSDRTEKDIDILFAQRLESEKGADLIPEIIYNIKKSRPRTNFRIFGQGSLEGQIRDRMQQLDIDIQIEPPSKDILEILSRTRVLVMPSRNEGLGMLAVESALCNCLVVASNIPGLNEVFSKQYRYYVDSMEPADFSEKALNALTVDLNEDTGWENERSFVSSRFSISNMAKKYYDLYVEVVGK